VYLRIYDNGWSEWSALEASSGTPEKPHGGEHESLVGPDVPWVPPAIGQTSEQPLSIRLSFTFADGTVSLVEQQPRRKPTSGTDALDYENEAGFWCELLDADGNRLFRRVMHDPMRADIEAFPSAPDGGPISRVSIERPSGSFDVVVPSLDAAVTVLIYRSPDDPEGSGDGEAAAEQIASFSLRGAA
jgi:hypothetical protein